MEDDPALQRFLALLQKDIAAHPQRVRGMRHSLYERILAVTQGVDGTVDEEIKVRLPSKRGRRDPSGGSPDRSSDPIHIAHGNAFTFHPLLHGFIKKPRTTPSEDLDLAIERMKEVKK
jgi:hypothetical protein